MSKVKDVLYWCYSVMNLFFKINLFYVLIFFGISTLKPRMNMREIIVKLPPNFCVHLEINVIILYNSNIFYHYENLTGLLHFILTYAIQFVKYCQWVFHYIACRHHLVWHYDWFRDPPPQVICNEPFWAFNIRYIL